MGSWRLLVALTLVAVCGTAFMSLQVDADRQGRLLVARQEGFFLVEADGAKVTLLAKPAKGTPIAARWSPTADRVLLAEVLADGRIALSVLTVADKTTVDLGTHAGLRWPLWCPDGASVSYLVREPPGFSLFVAPAAGGEPRKLIGTVAGAYDWIDKGRVLVSRLGSQQAMNSASECTLTTVDAATGEAKPVAKVMAGELAPMDVSPDGKEAIIACSAPDGRTQLSRIALAGGKVAAFGPEYVLAGAWSPDGASIAVVHAVDREITSQVTLAPGTTSQQGAVVSGPVNLRQKVRSWRLSALKVGGAGDVRTLSEDADCWQAAWVDSPLLPSWAGKDTVLYFRKTPVYGDAGFAIHLMSVKLAGGAAKDLQPAIDIAAAKVAKAP
jgi:hypothetical protein